MKRLSLVVPLALVGCGDVACPDGPDGCEIPSPCEGLAFECDAGSTEAYVITADRSPGLTGPIALSSPGDFVLANDQIVAVIEALDHPHDISPTGGGIVDLTVRGEPYDAFRHIFHATGLLPEDAMHYETIDLLDEGDVKAVLVTGRLDGYPGARVATRYEIRPCEPGVRVRTEVINGGPDPLSWFLTDAWYFGGRGSLPFTPGPGAGFVHPSFGLTTIGDAFRDTPYLATGGHEGPSASFAEVSCSQDALSGFHSAELCAVGPAPAVVYPGDWLVFERFIAAAPGASASGGVDIALEVRRQLHDEAWVTVSGTVEVPGVRADSVETSVVLSAGDVPWTQVFPAGDGSYAARVPAGQDYTVEVRAFGKVAGSASVSVGDADATVDPIVLDAPAEITLDATVDGVQDEVQVIVLPADDATLEATKGDFFGYFPGCAPYLGSPHGNSPACNRVLVNGPTTVVMQPGTYDFYASVGPFSTLAAARGVVVEAGAAQTLPLTLELLDVQPEGTLSGDFHVHGAASFDAQINDLDRARAFVASGIEVIATTEHDAAWDYAEALTTLGAEDRLALMVGTESTGHILFPYRTDSSFPRVVGHWNFWPITFDPDGPWHGPSWDELAEPGALFTRQKAAGWDDVDGVVELNHPVGGLQFGRDFGWASAAGFKLNEPLSREYDGTAQTLFFHQPEGAEFANSDYDVQEVMNGTNNSTFLDYRAFWFYLLDQGIVRGGVANSDSHSLTENVLATPRTLVWTDTTVAAFDPAVFNADLRAGRAIGTNGPVIVATLVDGATTTTPSLDAVMPSSLAVLHLEVTAAPWVPVDEVRIIVNGAVAQTIKELDHPTDPFGTDGIERLSVDVVLASLLPATGDAWIVIEAGHALEEAADLDCDGIPDTGDNNRDGAIDWRDVAELTEDPGVDCFDTIGPLAEPPEPERDTPDAWFRAVTPGGYPLAFTNPFLVDVDGNGFSGVAR
jgi:hypothetical protein